MPDNFSQLVSNAGAFIVSGIQRTPIFSDKVQAFRFAIFVVVLIGAGAIGWWEVRDMAARAGDSSGKNRTEIGRVDRDHLRKIEGLKGAVTDLRIGQVQLQTKVESEGNATRDVIGRQQITLDRILNKLDAINTGRGQ